MATQQLNLKVPVSIYQRLDEYVERTGVTKTEVVVNALAQYLGCEENVALLQRVAHIEARLAMLEAEQSMK